MKGNRQGSLSRSITRRSDQNRKIKYCFYFAILPQLVKKVHSDFFDKLTQKRERPQGRSLFALYWFRGSVTVKVVPFPSRLSSSTVPW